MESKGVRIWPMTRTLEPVYEQRCNFTKKPLVTIGICVKNCEATVKETIDSILDQDFPHELIEIIFVDDGSEDNTLSIIREYASRLDIPAMIFHTSWQGLGPARNIVVNNAKGKYIVWVDGDMVLSRDYVREQVEFMERKSSVGIAKGKYGLNPGANLIATLEIYSRAAGKLVDFNYDRKARSKALGTGGSIYRVKAIRQAGGFDENIKGYGEDWDAEYRIRAAGWLLYTTEVLFRDYERYGLTWKDLWRNYFRRGYDLHYFSHKNKGIINVCKMSPPAAFLSGLFHSIIIYKLVHQKVVFLLPLQYTLKMTAWCLGFIRAHIGSNKSKLCGLI